MARRPRFPVGDLPLHIVQRGNNRGPCFFTPRDYRVYLKILSEAAHHYGVHVHAYVLMTNHVHLLLTPNAVGAVSRMMQSIGARYVRYVNASLRRSGTLWEGRYRACLIATDRHLLVACRYIDLNPVRAGMVGRAGDYPWSSYLSLVGKRPDTLITPHSTLGQLGTPREDAYARWCDDGDRESDLVDLRKAITGELAFGSDAFKSDIEATTARAAFERPRGFPPRKSGRIHR